MPPPPRLETLLAQFRHLHDKKTAAINYVTCAPFLGTDIWTMPFVIKAVDDISHVKRVRLQADGRKTAEDCTVEELHDAFSTMLGAL